MWRTNMSLPAAAEEEHFNLPSHNSMPMPSDTEADACDIHRAQRIEITFFPITSHRRLNVPLGQFWAQEGNQRMRKYFVATDLSREAQHALGWAIGMVLRDADALMGTYAFSKDTVEDGGKIVPMTG
ncbi:unnamed protein product [Tuber aestivum]|uniref:Uncharacterized protein n=1 Tax=Tuber aestivum TaxID=59557 RepID=A0A292PWH6_9PEZI|nr:unnamed protein product [Tuber aestivum]